MDPRVHQMSRHATSALSIKGVRLSGGFTVAGGVCNNPPRRCAQVRLTQEAAAAQLNLIRP